MCDTSATLNHRYRSWNYHTTQRESKLGRYNDTISHSNVKSNLKYDVWNILKNNQSTDFKVPQQDVRERNYSDIKTSRRFVPQRVICYSAKTEERKDLCECSKEQGSRLPVKTPSRYSPDQKGTCCNKKSSNKLSSERVPEKSRGCCNKSSETPLSSCDKNPLNHTLRDVNKALSFKKNCQDKNNEVMETQELLRQQINEIESKEPETRKKFTEAQVMWCKMEENCRYKVQKALEKLDITQQEEKEIETSVRKWRRNKNNLEYEITTNNKYVKELTDIMTAKQDKINSTRKGINELKQKINDTKNQIKSMNEGMKNKKKASDVRIKSLSAEITNVKKLVHEEHNHKKEKLLEGRKNAKEARQDLQKIYRLSLVKKLENDLLRTQIDTLHNDIDIIKTNIGCFRKRFENKDKDLSEEIARVDSEIAKLKVKCAPCSKGVDTSDMRNFCTDCPRCVQERICLHDGTHCFTDVTKECVCTSMKDKFMDNVFKNMNTVLENQIQTPAGKKVANAVLESIRKSINGKLNEESRQILQDFILSGLKRNLNSTIIGGAMKTRCEMNTDAYNQLMLCLKDIQVPLPPEKDKSTAPKKKPCLQWKNESECHCPKGPNSCACTKISRSCDPKICRDTATEVTTCPQKKVSCGTMCGRVEVMTSCNLNKTSRRTSCNDKLSLSYNIGNTVVPQCISEESLSSFATKAHKMDVPFDPKLLVLYHQKVSNYESRPKNKKKGEDRKGFRYHKAYKDNMTNASVRCALVVR